MSTLLPPNASDLERNIETVTERATVLPLPLRDIQDPATCPAEFLPWLAWAEGVENWQSDWPEDLKRAKIAAAFNIKLHKGTVQSVRDAVAVFGSAITLLEGWQQNPPKAPHSFDVGVDVEAVDGDGVTDRLLTDIYTEVYRTKPARSYFSVTTNERASGKVGVFGMARAGIFTRLTLNTQLNFTAYINTTTGSRASVLTRLNLSQ